MSESTDPQLSFGVPLDYDDMEILNPDGDDDIDSFDVKALDPSGRIDLRSAWQKKIGDEFEFIEHCHSNEPMWLLVIRASVTVGCRGEVTRVDMNKFDPLGKQWPAKIHSELRRLGLNDRAPAGWLLTVMWR